MTKDQVSTLVKKAEELIKKASGYDIDWGAVNWGDIMVTDVLAEGSLMWGGDPNFVVCIEEADPNCYLAIWLTQELEKDYPNVTVKAEW